MIRNPNEKYSIDMNKSPTKVKNSVLKLVANDRYIPARSLFKVVLFEKVSFPGFNRKFHMIMGHSSIVLSRYIKTISGIIFERDDEAKSIERILPIDNTFVNMMKSKEPDCKTTHLKNKFRIIGVNLSVGEEKITFKFLSDAECLKFIDVLSIN